MKQMRYLLWMVGLLGILVAFSTSITFAQEKPKTGLEKYHRVDEEGYSYRGSDLSGPDLAIVKRAADLLKNSHPQVADKLRMLAARHG